MSGARTRRRWPWVLAWALVTVLVALVALVWWFPARFAWQWMAADYPSVYASHVRGTLWNGRMDGLVVAGQRIGTLRWTLDRAAVFGHVRGTIDVDGADVSAHARIRRIDDDTLLIEDAQFDVPVARLRALWPQDVQLDGRLQGTVSKARLVGGWPVQLDGRVRWHDAVVVADGRRVVLGDWLSRWQTSGGTVVTATFADDGTGALALHGTFTATALGWRLNASLDPRHGVTALRPVLARFGTSTPDGGIRIARHGGLMMGTTQ